MNPNAVLVALGLTLVSGGVLAQQSVVTGRVTTVEGGGPIVGATVTVERTGTRVVTDAQGGYRIEAMPDDTLHFEFIGYQTEQVGVAARSTIDVALLESHSTVPCDLNPSPERTR